VRGRGEFIDNIEGEQIKHDGKRKEGFLKRQTESLEVDRDKADTRKCY
jgi:hypothetical protein